MNETKHYTQKYHLLYNKFWKQAKIENCEIYECEGYLDFARVLYSKEIEEFKKSGKWINPGRKPIWFHQIMRTELPPFLVVKKGKYRIEFN